MRDLKTYYSYMDSPVGPLLLAGSRTALKVIGFSSGSKARGAEAGWQQWDEPFTKTRKQLTEYFAGRRKQFDMPLDPDGTKFQLSVLNQLLQIPYGETRSYKDIAQAIGSVNAVRAVGNANGSNPLPIVIPCHRVIGSDGSLTGFGGGLDAKRYLLGLEMSHSGLFEGV